MKSYYKLMLGQNSKFVDECVQGNFVGVHFGINENLTNKLTDTWQEFNKKYIPKYLETHPQKGTRAAGLACGTIWMLSKGFKIGDILLCPDGEGSYLVAEITSEYEYVGNQNLPHRRKVKWYKNKITKSSFSQKFQNSLGSIGTYVTIKNEYIPEIENALAGKSLISDKDISNIINEDDLVNFEMEKHLENFIIENWEKTDFSKNYDLYVDEDEDGGKVKGSQIRTTIGTIDILAQSKDKKEFLVIELKVNKTHDQVVGQVQRYMGYVLEELCTNGEKVRGVIIAPDHDKYIVSALKVTQNIELYKYQMSFNLVKFK